MPIPSFTRREVFIPQVSVRKAYAVVGMRRAGKTTFLWQKLKEQLEQGISREALLYFGFDDERLSDLKVADLGVILEEYQTLFPTARTQAGATLFLDEIQQVVGWERFVRRVLDTEPFQIYLSGSSARMLSREVATQMRGRALEIRIYPFSWREYLRHTEQMPNIPIDRLTTHEQQALQNALRHYLQEGGFPEAIGTDLRTRKELLQSYVDATLLRDVVERYEVSHPSALRWMVRQLLGNPCGAFSIHKFYNDLTSQGYRIGKDTLHDYLGYLEDSFLIRIVALSAQSERRRQVNLRKVYPIDMGLIALYDRQGQSHIGHALETAVLIELERRGAEIGYVRLPNHYEVDFHARYPNGSTALIQVCADISEPAVYEREIRSLIQARSEFPDARCQLVVSDPPHPSVDLPEGIELHLAREWLLQASTLE